MRSLDFLFGLPQPARRRLRAAAFLALLAVAAFVRFDGLGEPSLWLDEIMHVERSRQAMAEMDGASWTAWPTALSIDRENGALYYAGQIMALSVFDDPQVDGRHDEDSRAEFAARLMPALAGVLTVAVLFFAVLRASGSGATAAVAMALLAVAPLHVEYSREGRPYAAVILAATLMLLLAFQGQRRWVTPAIYLLAAVTACLGAVAAPLLVAFVPVAALSWWLRRRALDHRWRLRRDIVLALACGLALALMSFLFPKVPGLSQVTGTVVEAPDHGGDLNFVSPISARSLDRLLSSLTTSGLDSGSAVWLSFAMLALGLWGAARWALDDAKSAVWLIGLWLLPIAGWLVLLYRFDHWYNVRYTSAALPAFLALVAYGLVDGARTLSLVTGRFARRLPVAALPAALLVAALLAILVPNWTAARSEPWQKPDWRGVAELMAVLGDDETVIARDHWAGTCLSFYLRRHDMAVQLVNLDLAKAEELARLHPRGWVVSAGYRVGHWFEPFLQGLDPVLRAPRANLRVLRRPSFDSIRWDAVPAADGPRLARLLARFGETAQRQDFGRPEALLGAGWSVAEADPTGMTFRWAASQRAEIALVASDSDSRRPRALKIRAMPFPAKALPAQTVAVSIDGDPLTTVSLEPGWNELTLPAYSSTGPADHVVFDFGWAQSPRELDSTSGDGRSLAVAFDFVEIVEVESNPESAAKDTSTQEAPGR